MPSGGKGQKYEIAVSRYRSRRPGRRELSTAEEAAHDGVPARDRASSSSYEHLRRGESHPLKNGICDPYLFSGARLLLHSYSDHFYIGLRRRRQPVPCFDFRFSKYSARRRVGSTGTPISLPTESYPDRLRTAGRELLPRRLAMSTHSARRFGRKTRIPAGMRPSSG